MSVCELTEKILGEHVGQVTTRPGKHSQVSVEPEHGHAKAHAEAASVARERESARGAGGAGKRQHPLQGGSG